MRDRLLIALRKALAALQVAGVEYALIGGFAAAIRGRMRFTQDLDVLGICVDEAPIVAAFREQGFAHMDRADRILLDEVVLLRFWLPVEASIVSVGVDVQLARREHLEDYVVRAEHENYQGLDLRVVTREDLILLKLESWRPIDRADAIELAALSPSNLDWDYLKKRAQSRQVSDRLQEVCDYVATCEE